MGTRRRALIGLAVCPLILLLMVPSPSRPAPQAADETPKLWAVAIGVSQFANLPKDDWLEYADADASAFRQFIISPRGRGFPDSNVLLMTNADAGHQALRTRLADFLPRKVRPADTVYIFIATHGVVEKEPANEGYLLGYDSDRENLYSTTLRMQELAYILQTRLKTKRIFLFADACRSGKLGQSVNSTFADLSKARTETMILLASRPGELSREGSQFSGHGAFSYLLLKGLMGEADADKDLTVTASELVSYLQVQVPAATGNQQHIRELGDYEPQTPLAFTDKPGPPELKLAMPFPAWPALRGQFASLAPQASREDQVRLAFQKALEEGRLLSSENSAWSIYEQSAQQGLPEGLRDDLKDDLTIALATAGEKTISAYRRGDQVITLGAGEYEQAADLFAHASRLDPESREHQAKAKFLAGRALVARSRFAEAVALLRESVELDPRTAYSYNALGIAYMEQGSWNEAVRGFREALARADKWIYPRANLGRTYVAMGRYEEAEREFLRGIQIGAELGIRYSYLHYNLGMLYLHQNRTSEAQEQFRRAIAANAGDFRSHYNLALIDEERGNRQAAESGFRRAVALSPGFTEAWLRLAGLYRRQRRSEEEETALRAAAEANPRDAAILEPLGQLMLDRKLAAEAEQVVLRWVAAAPEAAPPFALLGDIHAAQGKLDQAADDYGQALARASDEKLRASLRKRLESLKKRK